MRNDKHLAIELRKKNLSYNEISRNLGVAKSTLCYWFQGLQWSKSIKEKLNKQNIRMAGIRMNKISIANKLKWEKWRAGYQKEARKDFEKLFIDPLFISGLSLYWGEGDSKLENGMVRLSNTDPRMIKVFSKFLKIICDVPENKIKVNLVLYPDLSEDKCKDFWSEVSEIPQSNFYKTQIIKGRHPTKRLKHGICALHVSSRGLKEKIMVWTSLFYDRYKI